MVLAWLQSQPGWPLEAAADSVALLLETGKAGGLLVLLLSAPRRGHWLNLESW